jgi:hypothetical protein
MVQGAPCTITGKGEKVVRALIVLGGQFLSSCKRPPALAAMQAAR